ncbi:MAG TPA: hypothetical protein ENN09_07305 [Planctomycetes bacterium]|nr:hypothetical protein [Planctomycetota bacterium]
MSYRSLLGRLSTAAAVVLLAAGCETMQSALLDAPPPPERLSGLPEWARTGVPCRVHYVGGEPVAQVPAFVDSPAKVQSIGYADVLARLVYLPSPMPNGRNVEANVTFSRYDSGGRTSVPEGTYWTGSLDWALAKVPGLTREMLLPAREKALAALIKGRLGPSDCWARTDVVPAGKVCATLEIYLAEPNAASAPDRVLITAHFEESKKEWVRDVREGETIFDIGARLFRLARISVNAAGRLETIEIDPWTPTIEDVVYMRTGFLVNVMGRAQAIRYINEFLLEWKTRGMRDKLREADVSELETLVVQMEKAAFAYDMEAQKAKDAAQAALAQGADASAPLEISRLFEQRMDILASILDTTKQVLIAKRKAAQ